MEDEICKWCGTWESCHGYDHLARECYPAQMKAKDAEIERLREQLSREWPAIEELTKEREMYRMRWLGSMTPEDAALIRTENERLRALLNDRSYIRAKADYNRGHLSHANYLESRERGLTLNDEQAVDK